MILGATLFDEKWRADGVPERFGWLDALVAAHDLLDHRPGGYDVPGQVHRELCALGAGIYVRGLGLHRERFRSRTQLMRFGGLVVNVAAVTVLYLEFGKPEVPGETNGLISNLRPPGKRYGGALARMGMAERREIEDAIDALQVLTRTNPWVGMERTEDWYATHSDHVGWVRDWLAYGYLAAKRMYPHRAAVNELFADLAILFDNAQTAHSWKVVQERGALRVHLQARYNPRTSRYLLWSADPVEELDWERWTTGVRWAARYERHTSPAAVAAGQTEETVDERG